MTRSRRSRATASSNSSQPPKLPRVRYFTRSRAKRLRKLGGEQDGRMNLLSDLDFWNMINVLKPTKNVPGKALGLDSINYNKKRNGKLHFTSEYELSDLVVRRGKPFTLTYKFDRDLDVDHDIIILQFVFGNRPQESKGTLIRLKLDVKNKTKVSSPSGKWSATVEKTDGATVEVSLTTPANAFVGKYGVFVETKVKDNEDSLRRFDREKEEEEICVLFNAWCENDLVYMPDLSHRYEYVLNDSGRIWVGSPYHGRPWNFGQFDNPVLEATLYLMDEAEIGDTARRSPITFIRTVSAMANSCDDDGVLEGRWSSEYPKNCTKPWVWTGSVKILEEFMQTKKPVKYGQCWVFSGLVTSLLRAIGIPTRSVTNFQSAHDVDCSMTIDTHFDEKDKPADWLDDSVWNFHVWNESFFRRVDLPSGYDGWQAHDATPQELSDGVMRCGPAPLRAIKEGHVYLNYDVSFIFSEVNGDKITWKVLDNGEMEVLDIDSRAVGKYISTKAVGSRFRHDLTLDYKYPEGSEEERKVVEFVHCYSSRVDENVYNRKKSDVEFKLVLPTSANLGENIEVKVRAINRSSEKRSVRGCLTASSCFYTGKAAKRIKEQTFDVEVGPGEENDLILEVESGEYLDKLKSEATMQAFACLRVLETEQKFARSQSFTLTLPILDIQVPDVIKAGEKVKGTVSFTNTLDINLTGGSFSLEGASVMSADSHNIKHAIKPGETVSYEFTILPRRAGEREIEATFCSDQLSGVDGSVDFEVQPKEEDDEED